MKSGKSLHDNIAVQFMNSIFTNALPGENEDEHTYTLKERFNQSNSVNNANENNIYGYEENHGDGLSEIHDQHSPPKYKDFNEQNMMMRDYNIHSRSRHHNRSRSRDKEREKNRYRDRERDSRRSRSKRYSRSGSREYRRSRSRIDDYRKKRGDSERYYNTGRNNYQRPYSSFSYTENGMTKINTDFTVPDHLVSLLIGKKGENVRSIMNSTGAVITFSKEVIIII